MYISVRCVECDCVLWSEFSRERKICPECFSIDEEIQDLEEILENLLNDA